MNEVRSTNELSLAEKQGGARQGQTNDRATSMKSKRQKQASLMGYVMHTLHDAYEAAIE
jgi:hypothetical protein